MKMLKVCRFSLFIACLLDAEAYAQTTLTDANIQAYLAANAALTRTSLNVVSVPLLQGSLEGLTVYCYNVFSDNTSATDDFCALLEKDSPEALRVFLEVPSSDAMTSALSGKLDTTYVPSWASISGKPAVPVIIPQTAIAEAYTDAPANAVAGFTVGETSISELFNQLNSTTGKQNALAEKYNDLAAKFNALLEANRVNNIVSP